MRDANERDIFTSVRSCIRTSRSRAVSARLPRRSDSGVVVNTSAFRRNLHSGLQIRGSVEKQDIDDVRSDVV